MSEDLDDGGQWFDQSFQQVDIQYNADEITIVSQLGQGPSGKQCPRCNASPMRRSQIVWEDNTRRTTHGMMILNTLAKRASPPRRPWLPQRRLGITSMFWSLTIPAITTLIVSSSAPSLAATAAHQHQSPATVALYMAMPIPFISLLALVVVYWVRRHRQLTKARREDRAAFDTAAADYQSAKQLWRRSWLCLQCGVVSAERD